MPFGLRNAAATFQRFMNEVTSGLDFCFVYIDDILVASASEEEHRQHLCTLFARLQHFGIAINLTKCIFGQPVVTFLGHRINADGLSPSPQKVQAIIDMPEPRTVKGLRRFLGMINFYNRFLKNIARIQAPLQQAISGNKRNNDMIAWTPTLQDAFHNVKNHLAQATLLVFPSTELSLHTDASEEALGAVLQQKLNGTWQPLCYFSKKLSLAQKHYSTYDRELLAIYSAIKHFRFFLEGRLFHVFTDHKPLLSALKRKQDQMSSRQIRQLTFISEVYTYGYSRYHLLRYFRRRHQTVYPSELTQTSLRFGSFAISSEWSFYTSPNLGKVRVVFHG